MKRIISSLMLALAAAVFAGCEAGARVGDPDEPQTERRRTVVRPPADGVEAEAEIRRD